MMRLREMRKRPSMSTCMARSCGFVGRLACLAFVLLTGWPLKAAPSESDLPLPALTIVLPELPERIETPPPDVAQKAQELDDAIRTAYREGQYEQALETAQQAFKLLPQAATALNVGAVLVRLQRPQQALVYLLLALDLGPDAAEQAKIEKHLGQVGPLCQPPMGWVRGRGSPSNAVVTLTQGARQVSFPAIRTIGLPEGEHRFSVMANGYMTADAKVPVTAGVGSPLTFQLHLAEADPAPRPESHPTIIVTPVEPSKPAHGMLWTWGWATLSGGLGLLTTGGVVFGIGYHDLDAAKTPAAWDSAKPKWNAGVGLLTVGSLTAAAGAVLLIIDSIRDAGSK